MIRIEIKINSLRKAAKEDNQYPLRMVDGVRWHMRQDMLDNHPQLFLRFYR